MVWLMKLLWRLVRLWMMPPILLICLLAEGWMMLRPKPPALDALLQGVFTPTALQSDEAPSKMDAAKARQAAVETYPWPARLVLWLLVALLLPLGAAPLVSRGLEMESNAVNLLMLLGLTTAAGLTAYAMVGFRLDTGLAATLLLAGVALALVYNWSVLTKLDELRVN